MSKRAGEEGLKNPGPDFDLLAPAYSRRGRVRRGSVGCERRAAVVRGPIR
jgi:hypothetical protein